MDQQDVEASGVFLAKLGNQKESKGSDDIAVRDRNEINLRSRKQRRSRKGRTK